MLPTSLGLPVVIFVRFSGMRVFVSVLVVLLPLLAMVTSKKSTCPTLPCNPCQCKKMSVCGGNLRNGNGILQLPDTGPNSCLRCQWTLSVPPQSKIRLSFSQVHLGSGDWIKVYDGARNRDPLIVKYEVGSTPTDLVTSRNKMMVLFQSDRCGEASRFRASFQAAECGGLIQLDPYKKSELKAIVQSPRFPRLYPNNANCLWTVVGKEGLLSPRVTVHSVETERDRDFVKIYASISGPSSVRSYSGILDSVERFRVYNVPGITLQFESDKNVAEKGFKITVQAMKSVSLCPKPRKLLNGRVVTVDHKRTALYYCCSGYHLIGSPRMTCNNSRWMSRSRPQCVRLSSCSSPNPPDNSYIVGGQKPTAFGSVVRFRCNPGFQFVATADDVVTATCRCTGQWKYAPTVPRCDAKTCVSPPPDPQPGGTTISNAFPPYGPGTIVRYTCPDGYGLDGIPYRICNRLGEWEPSTRLHKCRQNMNVCPDPGTPGNGTRRVVSFGDGHLAGFGCMEGYRAEGNQLRTCHASNPNDTYWSGVPTKCIDLFKAPFRLAAQWRENFIDRSILCLDEDDHFEFPTNESLHENPIVNPPSGKGNTLPTVLPPATSPSATVKPTPTAESIRNNSDNSSDNSSAKRQGRFCRGRAVAVGDGCLDLIYAIDCSKSINQTSFNQSLEFVGSSVSLFDIDAGQANVALFTYDDEVHDQFGLGDIKTTEKTVNAIKSAYYCQGSTATRPVLLRIEKEITERSNDSCRKAVFILTDGRNNWGGDPQDIANRLKEMTNVEIYTIAFGTNSLNWEVLRSLASKPEYFIPVRHPGDIRKAIADAHDIKIDYSSQCGTTSSPDCRARVVNGCNSNKGAWPWMVAIYDNKNKGYNFRCGGTLIDDCWVLTAAHCLPKDENIAPENLLAVLGDTERFVKEFTESSHEIEQIFVHNQFNDVTFDNDIALLKLKCSAKYRSQIRKGCLPRSGDEQYYNRGTKCIVAGWGHTEVAKDGAKDLTMSTVLRHVELPVEDLEECKRTSGFPVTDNMVCAGSGNKDGVARDACRGDSGGPLFCKRTGDGVASYVVVGVVSWGEGCAQKGKYGYFTHVQRMIDWIDQQMVQKECQYSYKDCPVPRKTLF